MRKNRLTSCRSSAGDAYSRHVRADPNRRWWSRHGRWEGVLLAAAAGGRATASDATRPRSPAATSTSIPWRSIPPSSGPPSTSWRRPRGGGHRLGRWWWRSLCRAAAKKVFAHCGLNPAHRDGRERNPDQAHGHCLGAVSSRRKPRGRRWRADKEAAASSLEEI